MQIAKSKRAMLLCLTMGVGCDGKVGSDYEGEALLSLRGSVAIEGSEVDRALVPALAFFDHHTGVVEIVDVVASGQFPASFQLDVFAPPSANALLSQGPTTADALLLASPPFAFGYITAVPQPHLQHFAFHGEMLSRKWCEPTGLDRAPTNDELEAASRAEIPGVCFDDLRARGPDGVERYRRTKRCQSGTSNCSVDEMGDPMFLQDPYQYFSGFSINYAILYVSEAAGPDSALAHAFAAGRPLAAGYHLLAGRPYTEEELAQDTSCKSRADAQAVERYNAAHGTSYASILEVHWAAIQAGMMALQQLPTEWRSPLDLEWEATVSSSSRDPAVIELSQEQARAAFELGCSLTQAHFEIVDEPEQEDIAVRIGQKYPTGLL